MSKSVGILGIGTYLPTEVRTNAWWPDHVVNAWREKAVRRLDRMTTALSQNKSEGARRSLEALTAVGDDPFHGARERRVIADTMKASDMETIAAREAIARAGIDKDEIDLVLSHQLCTDYINLASACVVQNNLGLRERTMALAVDAACNSFMMQLNLAQAMIASGQARYALLTQSSAYTRFPASGEPIDAWGGDAASAVVVGPVSDGYGVLSRSHHVDGSLWGTLVCGVPKGRWHDDRCIVYSEDPRANMTWLVGLADRAQNVIEEAITGAGLAASDIGFYASHQGFAWFQPVTQACAGLSHARSIEHFQQTAAISSVHIPFQLAVGEKEGLLHPGDVIACFQGGTGMTWSGMTLRWGRA